MTDDWKSPPGAIPREFPHSMLREIYEQPQAIRETILRNIHEDVIFPTALDSIENELFAFKKIIIVASGSSRHAALVGEIMMEDLAGVVVDVGTPRSTVIGRHTLVMTQLLS